MSFSLHSCVVLLTNDILQLKETYFIVDALKQQNSSGMRRIVTTRLVVIGLWSDARLIRKNT
jgi:hypothetical protein